MKELISRQAAIDYFVTNVGFCDEDGYPIEDTDELRKIWTEYFSGIPSAEPKKGKWLPENRTIDAFWVCSSCGFPSEAHAANILYKYCPNCGAEMEVPKW